MKVLFVEDDPMNRRVVKDMLGVVGASMSEAPDAHQGLQMASAEEYDAILMDLRMPGMDGLTAIRALRSGETGNRRVPIIVVTAETGLHLRGECVEAGADDLLQKPVAMRSLLRVLGQTIASARTRQVLN